MDNRIQYIKFILYIFCEGEFYKIKTSLDFPKILDIYSSILASRVLELDKETRNNTGLGK